MPRERVYKTPEDLENKIEEYFEDCDIKERPYTWDGLSLFLKIHRATLYRYGEREDYADIVEFARLRISDELQVKTLQGEYDKTMAIFTLKNFAGMSDKVENEVISHNTNVNKNIDMSNLTTEQIKELLENED